MPPANSEDLARARAKPPSPAPEAGRTESAVSERKHLEDATAHARRLEAVGQLAGGVAHDFNNVLASMQLQLLLLDAMPDLAPAVRTAVGQLRQDADRAASLTRQLLTYGGRQVMQLATLELGRQTGQLARTLEALIGPKIRLGVQCVSSAWVHADPTMIDQMITNMVLNARDAIGERSGTISLQLTRRTVNGADQRARARQGEFACLSIRDSGAGLSDEARAHLFEPFFTTKPVGQGKGLGLATAYAIAEQHQGWIDVESRLNEGTVFTIFLPLAIGPLAGVSAPRESGSSPGGTILLVDDEPSVRKLTRLALERHGFRVLEAKDGPTALALWQRHRNEIDVLLSDMVMPNGLTGRELAETVTAEQPAVGVILTSGYSLDLKRAGVPPGVSFLPKPFPLTKLLSLIRGMIERRSTSA